MISLFTLNLWRYYDFDKRFVNIVGVLKKKKPDVLFFQETQMDESVSPYAQVEIIKKEIPEYVYSIHSTIYLKESQRGEKLKKPIQHGMSVLSKYPILHSFEYYLPKKNDIDEPRSVLCFDVEIHSQVYRFANIHFMNNESGAKEQLEVFLKLLTARNEKRIMVGDFNLYDLLVYSRESDMLQGYLLSRDFREYVSYPEKKWCLDYVLVPKEFNFESVDVVDEYLSDHLGVYVKISRASIS